MTKLVITGGLGFIFSHVTEFFLEKGWEVHVFDNLSVGSHPELLGQWALKYGERFQFHRQDVSLPSVIYEVGVIDPDYIVHAAAISDVDYSIENPYETIHYNNEATIKVFEAARKCTNLKKILYVSTDEIMGECDHPKKEDELLWPKNPYSLSKAFGSLLRITYDSLYPELKDKTVETRFCNVFGERQDKRKIIPALIESVKNGYVVPIHNGGVGSREYIYVGNIPPVIEMLLEKGNRVYNVSNSDSFTVNELVTIIEDATGGTVKRTESTRQGMDMRYQIDSSRIREEFNWEAKYSFRDGLFQYLQSERLI